MKWLAAALLAGALLLAALWARGVFLAPGPAAEASIFIVEAGAGLRRSAVKLEAEGRIADALGFRVAARLFGDDKPIRRGEYALPPHASMAEILRILQSGAVIQHRFTVREGSRVADVVAAMEAEPALVGGISPPPEGSLLPETYFFTYGETRSALLARMTAAMNQALADAWSTRAAGLPLDDPTEALTLASIVEKETGIAAERPLVAAVFINRLRLGMRLQSDPTVIYGRGGNAPLSKADLAADHPYNSYLQEGLPPGPIANPGGKAIMAVLHPADSDALYFVADGGGGHIFAATHQAHLRNVARWRRIEAERRKGN